MKSIDKQIALKLKSVKNKRGLTIISRSELMYLHQTIEELISFFHQPNNYKSIDSLKRFMGNKNGGMYKCLVELYYHVLANRMPADLMKRIRNGEFDSMSFEDKHK